MKPIRLEIEGINSYEKKQIIDFETLISRGIFGIFGKTGSGKSTILDAITLALYGNIARGTKGFINSNVNDAMVLFRFELGNGGKREVYEVTRKFKKVINEDKISAKSGSIKLLKIKNIDGDYITEVLADKVKDVDSKIYEILGLTEADFLKSVVLPQGKFSEFLLLNGKAKRDMLERIFGLEEYGTNLAIKLAAKKKKVENDIEVLKGKIGEFSDVTEENIKFLKEKSHDCSLQLKEYEKSVEKELKILNEFREINQLNIEKKRYLSDLLSLNEKKDLISDYKNRIENSNKVSDIIFEIDRKIELENELKEVINQGKKLKEEHTIISKNYNNAKNEFLKISEFRNKIPEIKSSNFLVKRIYESEEELIKLVFNSKNLANSKSLLTSKIESLKENISKVDSDFNKIKIEISNNKIIETENSFSIDYREIIDKANELQRELELLLKNKSEIKCKNQSLNDEIKKIEINREELKIKFNNISDKIFKKELESKELRHFQMVSEIRDELLTHKDKNCSCPVCGNKVVNFDFDNSYNIQDFTTNLDKFKNDLEILNRNKEQINSDLIKFETIYYEKIKSRDELEKNILKIEEEVLSIKENLNPYIIKYGIDNFKDEKIKVQNSEKLILELRNKNLELEKKLDDITLTKIENEKILNEYSLDLEVVKNRYVESSEKIDKILIEIRSDLKDLNFNSYVSLLDFKEKIKNIEYIENLLENVIKKDIEVLKNLYCFSNDFCKNIDIKFKQCKTNLEKIEENYNIIVEKHSEKQGQYKTLKNSLERQIDKTNILILNRGFSNEDEVKNIKLSDEEMKFLLNYIEDYNNSVKELNTKIKFLESKLNGKELEENQLREQEEKYSDIVNSFETLKKESIETNLRLKNMVTDIEKVKTFSADLNLKDRELDVVNQLDKVLKGKKFVEFLSKVYLKNIVFDASHRLDSITNGRYSLEIDSEYSFVVSDNINGGIRRSIDTLSGGEIFLTSLSLALALSTQIQLKGSAPLEFFFLDEGFGTLDRELLEVVMESLEKLHSKNLSVGVISHVEELKNRIPTKLVVEMDKEKLTSIVNIEYS